MRARLPRNAALAVALAWAGVGACAGLSHGALADSPSAATAGRTDDAALTLDRLMGLLAHRQHARARFEEEQDLAVLTQPLRSAGLLSYDAPDHLEQLTLTPRRQLMRLDGGMLTVQIGAHRRTLPLTDQPQLAALIESLRATLAGDGAALARQFVVHLEGTLARWQLQLTPRESSPVRSLSIEGSADRIRQVQILRSNGDRVRMHIEPLP